MFLARNQLTETTALGLLHLLRHLGPVSGCALLDVNMTDGYYKLNHELARPNGLVTDHGYKFPRLRCRRLYLSSMEPYGRLRPLFSHCHTVILPLPMPMPGQLPQLLMMIERNEGSAE